MWIFCSKPCEKTFSRGELRFVIRRFFKKALVTVHFSNCPTESFDHQTIHFMVKTKTRSLYNEE